MFLKPANSRNEPTLNLTTSPQDSLTKYDFFRGTQVFGATGGGKTTGAGAAISGFLLEAGFGGLVLCVKEDEAAITELRAKGHGRQEDIRRFTIDSKFRFNFLDWFVASQTIFSPSSVADLFVEIVSVASRAAPQSAKDPFWNQVLARVLTNAVSLCYLAKGRLQINDLYRIVFAANSLESTVPGLGLDGKSHLEGLVREALNKAGNAHAKRTEIEISSEFLLNEFAQLAEKTRSVVYTMFMNLAEQLRREPLNSLFQTTTTLEPKDILEGKIVIVDIPIHRFDSIGRMANAIWKTCFKNAVERRGTWKMALNDVFLWADESQYIVDQSDARFQTTARGNRCATVYLTQNLQNYLMEIRDKATVFALIESLTVRFYHQNGDVWTNEEATKRIGAMPIATESTSRSKTGSSTTTSEAWINEVPARMFTNLRAGGAVNQHEVSAIVHVLGKRFSNNKTWLEVSFKQRRD